MEKMTSVLVGGLYLVGLGVNCTQDRQRPFFNAMKSALDLFQHSMEFVKPDALFYFAAQNQVCGVNLEVFFWVLGLEILEQNGRRV
jgi:hypothetical protein